MITPLLTRLGLEPVPAAQQGDLGLRWGSRGIRVRDARPLVALRNPPPICFSFSPPSFSSAYVRPAPPSVSSPVFPRSPSLSVFRLAGARSLARPRGGWEAACPGGALGTRNRGTFRSLQAPSHLRARPGLRRPNNGCIVGAALVCRGSEPQGWG